jgi:hypothetical protein
MNTPWDWSLPVALIVMILTAIFLTWCVLD